jgi:hypothetical protein
MECIKGILVEVTTFLLGKVLLPDAIELFGVTSYVLTVLAGIVLLLRKWYSGKLKY